LIGVSRSISTVTSTFSTLAGSIRISATRPTGMPRYSTWPPSGSPLTDPAKAIS
jgi:hypothetical protein